MSPLTELKPYQAPRLGLNWDEAGPAPFRWTGYLTTQNAEHVAQRIREQFVGRALVAVYAHEARGYAPEVRGNPVWIPSHSGIHCEVLDDHAMVSFSCGSRLYMIDTWHMHEQPAIRGDLPTATRCAREVLAWIDEVELRDRNPLLEFTDRSLLVRHRAPAPDSHYWLRFDQIRAPVGAPYREEARARAAGQYCEGAGGPRAAAFV